MSHSYFIHSCTDGHLSCFDILAIVNNGAMKKGCLCSFELVFLVPSDIFPEVGPLGQNTDPFWIIFLIVFQLQFFQIFVAIFPWLISHALSTILLPQSIPTLLCLSMDPLYMFLDLTLPFFPPLSSSLHPSGHCQFVLYFHVSGSILLICLFCGLGSTYRWDHMVFVFHCLAYFT